MTKYKILLVTNNISKHFFVMEENMCGIIGYIGKDNPKEILLTGLKNQNIEDMTQREQL